MTHASFEMLWVCSLLHGAWFSIQYTIPMYSDNQATIFVMSNPSFYECTKHIKIDYHAIHDRALVKLSDIVHVSTSRKIVDIFSKGLGVPLFDLITHKLNLFDLYAQDSQTRV